MQRGVIRQGALDLSNANLAAFYEQVLRASQWIVLNRTDLTFGTQPDINRVADDDHIGLADLECHGQAGNAVLLYKGDFGKICWCDPEGRASQQHRFLIFVPGLHSGSTYLLQFTAQ